MRKKQANYKALKDFINDEVNNSECNLKGIVTGKEKGLNGDVAYYTGEIVAFREVMKFLDGADK